MESNTFKPKLVNRIVVYAYSIALILFVSGLFSFFYFLNDYKKVLNPLEFSMFFSKEDDTSTLAGMIASTTGLLWSFAGVILFAFNIKQTQHEIELQIKEMKEQGETFTEQMLAIKAQSELLKAQATAAENQSKQYNIQTAALLLQQKENSLNNLLSNYFNVIKSFEVVSRKDKVTGYLALNHIYSGIRNAFQQYLDGFRHRSFSDSKILEYQYSQIFEGGYKSQINTVVENFEFMHRFIKDGFEDSEIYFNRLYNCYSDAEKYIIGHYIINVKNSQTSYLSPFDFTSFLKEKSYYDKSIHYLPIFSLDFLFNDGFIIEKIRKPLDNVIIIDFEATVDKVFDKLFLSCEIIENDSEVSVNVEYVKTNFITTLLSTGATERQLVEFKKNEFNFENKEFKIPFAKGLEAAFRILERHNTGNLIFMEFEIQTEIDLNLSNGIENKTIEIAFQNKLEISEGEENGRKVYCIRIKQ